jgi:hypothetical protein
MTRFPARPRTLARPGHPGSASSSRTRRALAPHSIRQARAWSPLDRGAPPELPGCASRSATMRVRGSTFRAINTRASLVPDCVWPCDLGGVASRLWHLAGVNHVTRPCAPRLGSRRRTSDAISSRRPLPVVGPRELAVAAMPSQHAAALGGGSGGRPSSGRDLPRPAHGRAPRCAAGSRLLRSRGREKNLRALDDRDGVAAHLLVPTARASRARGEDLESTWRGGGYAVRRPRALGAAVDCNKSGGIVVACKRSPSSGQSQPDRQCAEYGQRGAGRRPARGRRPRRHPVEDSGPDPEAQLEACSDGPSDRGEARTRGAEDGGVGLGSESLPPC